MSAVVILPRTSDERLLELVRDGEERAFEIVVRRYRASLVGYCMRMGLSESRAEDAVQQCFLSALLALRRGDEVRDLRAWLGRIAHNVAVNLMRAGSANRETWLGTDWGIDERAIHIPDMDGGLAAREALAEVAALPPMQREALLQSALGGRSYGEVAASMGVTEGAVRGLLHRARLSLRKAAAIFSPLPLIRRISGWLGGASPSAGRVLELSAPGATSGLSSTAVRALGAGLTAIVLAAGVAVAPIHGSSPRSARVTAQTDGSVLQPATAAAMASASPVAAATATTKALGPATKGSPSGASSTTATPGAKTVLILGAPAGGQTPHRSGGATGTTLEAPARIIPATSGPAQVSSAGPSGSGTVTEPTAPPAKEPSGEVKQPTGEAPGSEGGAEKERSEKAEQAEREEEAREREREEAAEKAEREREEAAGKSGKGD